MNARGHFDVFDGVIVGAGLMIAAILAAPLAAAAPVTTHWSIDGAQREALIYPPTVRSAKVPVLFAFHGHGGSMERMAGNMRYQELMPRAVVVYMQGLATPSFTDPAGRARGWQSVPGQLGDRDLKFFDAVLAGVRARYRVDERRIYVAGYSNGALFAFLLWSQRGRELAAIGICAGVLLPEVHLTVPRPVVHIAGRADEIAKFARQEETIAAERKVNGNKAAVEVFIHNGGHMPPPWTATRIVQFFTAQAK